MKKGIFITLEGIDGCGKTTQVLKTAKYLYNKSKYNTVIITREPYKDQDIRKIISEDNNPYTKAGKLAEMFIEDRKNHIKEVINPSIDAGIHVICDRYSMSTLAYQWTQGVSLEKLIEMHGKITVPDITFLIDIPAEIAIQRKKKDNTRKAEKKFEKEIEFIIKLRSNYLQLVNKFKDYNIVLVNGTDSTGEIFGKKIKPHIDKLYQLFNNR